MCVCVCVCLGSVEVQTANKRLDAQNVISEASSEKVGTTTRNGTFCSSVNVKYPDMVPVPLARVQLS